MLISFIIPAHNEEKDLPATLTAITRTAAAMGLEHQVIVADDASTDGTPRIAQEHGAMVVRHERRQIAATRNLGARAATGEVLFFIDADTQIEPANVGEALALLNAGAVGGGGPIRFDGPVSAGARVVMHLFNMAFRIKKLAGGCFIFCKREAYDKVGGWDETLYASEEIELAKQLKRHGKFRIIRTPVTTSGRKMRTYTFREMIPLIIGGLLYRRKFVETRDKLDLWYAPRREDPWEVEKATQAGSLAPARSDNQRAPGASGVTPRPD